MDKQILDEPFYDNKDIKKALSRAGIKRFFEKKNGEIVVQESDAIQVGIRMRSGRAQVRLKFPQIGNSVQVVSTLLLLILAILMSLPYPYLIAILGGQLLSYGWFRPKIKTLQGKVETALQS